MSYISKEFNEIADTVKRIEIEGDKENFMDISDETAALLVIAKRLENIESSLSYIAGSAERMEELTECVRNIPAQYPQGKSYKSLSIIGQVSTD